MQRSFYTASIAEFRSHSRNAILGQLVQGSSFAVEQTQRDAWLTQVDILQVVLADYHESGSVYFEYNIPRLGKRIDAVVLIGGVMFVMEFKVGEEAFTQHALDQVYDYALDLKHFHESSHDLNIAPVLIATRALPVPLSVQFDQHGDGMIMPIRSAVESLSEVIASTLRLVRAPIISRSEWEAGRYRPTPTIIEAATALYGGHGVKNITRNDAGEENLEVTSKTVSQIIHEAQERSEKIICFVTGVPGAGKTLVGLDVATRHLNRESKLYSVFLSGNGPLVAVLCEALARDKVARSKDLGIRVKKKRARSEVQAFIQNVHHFRDDCLTDLSCPPVEHVALFDEAQRAWNLKMTAKFMQQKKGRAGFSQSESEFLIGCLDRHKDWAVIVCLVGGGQEINTGEAGIGEWIESVLRAYPHWQLRLSSRLTDSEYGAGQLVERVRAIPNTKFHDELHLSVSMRSFRAERVSLFIKQVLDLDTEAARETLSYVNPKFPLVLTRDVQLAKQWLRNQSRGNERFGLVVSSQAQRLRPHAIDVRAKINPVHWFLHEKDDVRSSFYLEDAATEFQVQGLELDWVGVVWDGDFRHTQAGWGHYEFKGKKWNRIRKVERQAYLKNAYRVLLTRARQGMVVVVPEGNAKDHTRDPSFYDSTYSFFAGLGIPVI